VEAIYRYPRDGIFYLQLVGEAEAGPNGEEEAGGAFATCTPGNGIACYTGGFALDLPDLAPGGPKPLEITGPIKFSIDGGSVTLRMKTQFNENSKTTAKVEFFPELNHNETVGWTGTTKLSKKFAVILIQDNQQT
jgi:hypothetical protein